MSRIIVDHYREQKPLGHLRRPKLTVYRAANPRAFKLVLNRYPGSVIGVAAQMWGRVLSLTWGTPANRKPIIYRY